MTDTLSEYFSVGDPIGSVSPGTLSVTGTLTPDQQYRLITAPAEAEVTLKGHSPTELGSFEAAIGAMPHIVEASHVTGSYDYLLKVVVRDMAEWTGLAEDLTTRDLGIDRINTHVLMRKPKVFVGYPVEVR